MIRMEYFIRRPAGMSLEAFLEHWREKMPSSWPGMPRRFESGNISKPTSCRTTPTGG